MNMVPAKLAGYDIPAFTYVMISNIELGVNSSIWPRDAEQFRPERWEVNAVQQLQDPELRINPFGLGRRSCPGMALGSTLVLLCLATLVQSFHWGPDHGQNREDIDMRAAIHGLMPMQTPLKALATPRSRSWEID
jgi:cytochrome P450